MSESEATSSASNLWWFHLLIQVMGVREVPHMGSSVSGAGLFY